MRRKARLRADFALALSVLAALTLAGCSGQAPVHQPTSDPLAAESGFVEPSATPSPKKVKPAPPPEPSGTPLPAVPAGAMQSRDPAVVLAAWGHAVEARDWAAVRAFWGEHGTMSGLAPQAFARRWSVLKQPRVTIDIGVQEGAAGSSYYTAPVTLIDMAGQRGERRISGQVVLRRVNDVDGATPEQLRWHIEKSSITP